jgi:hypothetical protein
MVLAQPQQPRELLAVQIQEAVAVVAMILQMAHHVLVALV